MMGGGIVQHPKEPSGADILAKLIELYADQEGIQITYELEQAVSA